MSTEEEYIIDRAAFKKAYLAMIDGLNTDDHPTTLEGLTEASEASEGDRVATLSAVIHLESYDKRLTYFL